MGYLYIALFVIAIISLTQGGRRLLKELFSQLWRGLSIVMRAAFGLVVGAHITIIANLAPRDIVIKSLDGDETSKRKQA